MKERIILNGNEHGDGGLERAESILGNGNDVIVENFYYERDRDAFLKLANKLSVKISFSADFSMCQIEVG